MSEQELREIEVVESSGGFDKTLYEGYRATIGKVKMLYVQDTFPDGQTYTPDSKEMKWVLRIFTEPLKILEKDEVGNAKITDKLVEFPNEDGSVDNLKINTDLNFQAKKDDTGKVVKEKQTVEYEDGEEEEIEALHPVISKAPKAALWKFMRKMGVTDYRQLEGKIVTLTLRPAKKEGDDRVFINIVTE